MVEQAFSSANRYGLMHIYPVTTGLFETIIISGLLHAGGKSW